MLFPQHSTSGPAQTVLCYQLALPVAGQVLAPQRTAPSPHSSHAPPAAAPAAAAADIVASLNGIRPLLDALPNPTDLKALITAAVETINNVLSPALQELSTALSGLVGKLQDGTYSNALGEIAGAEAFLDTTIGELNVSAPAVAAEAAMPLCEALVLASWVVLLRWSCRVTAGGLIIVRCALAEHSLLWWELQAKAKLTAGAALSCTAPAGLIISRRSPARHARWHPHGQDGGGADGIGPFCGACRGRQAGQDANHP